MAETGWHRHGSEPPSRDESCIMCEHLGRLVPPAVPILLLPLDGLEETIARALVGLGDEHDEIGWTDMDKFECACGDYVRLPPVDGSVDRDGAVRWHTAHLAHRVARALAGDGAR